MKMRAFVWAAVAALFGCAPAAPRPEPPIAVGEALPQTGALRDVRGNRVSPHAFKSYKAIVLAFVGVDCPLANLYLPRLVELEERFGRREVKFIGLYPNEGESLERIAAHGMERDVPFLLAKDIGRRVADRVGVDRTPTVAVLDGACVLRYRGRIDDQYGAAYRREKPSREDLAKAIEEVVAGRPVSVAETEADGCLVSRESALPRKEGVTYARDVAPILQNRCQSCHRPGEIGPFPLLTYENAAEHARMMKEVVVQRRMPPWHADPRFGRFRNERRLSDDEIGVLASWIDAGMPRGNPSDEPPPKAWPEGWSLGRPDAVFSIPREVDVPAQGVMPYLHFTVPTDFAEDRWIERAEVRPGDPSVVHHVLVYLKRPGRDFYDLDGTSAVIVGWVPGDAATIPPPGVATRLPKGAEIVFEVHYTPTGKATKDRTSVGFTFAAKPPARESRTNVFWKLNIAIAPHAPHHRHESALRLAKDARIVSLVPHMHMRGKSWRYEIAHPDGRVETILSVPRWDFNWQSTYRFEEPVKLPKGAQLRSVVHWDNSDNNPLNPDASKTVRWGLQTWEEMMNGWVTYVWEEPDRP
jgi:hypothetical protein